MDVECVIKEMGGLIVYGYFILLLILMLIGLMMNIEGVICGINYGCNKVRFINMVFVGSKVWVW